MAGLMDELVVTLETQLELYRELLKVSKEKKDVIVKNDTKTLQRLTSEENTIVGKLHKLDKKRIGTMFEIGTVLNIPDREYTLSALCGLLQKSNKRDYERLFPLTDDTRSVLEELKNSNTHNKTLIENSLEYIEFSVNLIRTSDKKFYDTRGEEIGLKSGFFDAKQ
ncbi:hypothetical protein AGMMS49975_05110 [Clostridia bacterium]|nr:hypothetical protein AGMMS49975_05110 [Clostridia bacterium]